MNIGLPLLECPEAVDGTNAGDLVEVTLATGEIRNLTKKATYQAKPYPEFMLELMNAGGLIEYTRKRLESRRTR
jgi:3-isopropylmalate/(R)-2-methylmalate dehydratase small subunit